MKRSNVKPSEVDVVRKRGNVFAHLGRPDSDDLIRRRARILTVINDAIARRRLTQEAAADLIGIDQADVSRLANGRVSRFSLERLMTIVDRLGVDVAIEQRRDASGQLIVEVRELGSTAVRTSNGKHHPRSA
jgi:predicted XRE-type DNA-binding protein